MDFLKEGNKFFSLLWLYIHHGYFIKQTRKNFYILQFFNLCYLLNICIKMFVHLNDDL